MFSFFTDVKHQGGYSWYYCYILPNKGTKCNGICTQDLGLKCDRSEVMEMDHQEGLQENVVFPVMRKRTARKDDSGAGCIKCKYPKILSDQQSQCNLLHGETYSKGCQTVTPCNNRSTQSEDVQVKHACTQMPCKEHYQRGAIQTAKDYLEDVDNLNELLLVLERHNQISDFITLLEGLKTGRLPADNISWLCMLDRARYANCKSTTLMKYRPETLEFWGIVYLLFGNSALSVFRGSTHFGQVVTERCKRGMYDPQDGICNFSVPSLTTLRKVDTGFARCIDPGFIEPTLKMAQERSKQGKQFTLALDGKKIGKNSIFVYV